MINLEMINKNCKNAIVIRHAERDNMERGQIWQPLNEAGEKQAQELGKKLKSIDFSNYRFFSSPVDRCVGTCRNIQKGLELNYDEYKITESNILGEPGPYVIERKNNAFKDFDCKTVIEKQIVHEKLAGIRSTEEGAKILIDFVLKQMENAKNGEILIFCTHDAIVGPTIFELTGESFGHESWPEFADGFIIEDAAGKFSVIRKSQKFNLRKF